MDEAIQDCIGNCGISHGPMPMFQGELTGQDGGTMLEKGDNSNNSLHITCIPCNRGKCWSM